MLSWPIIPKFNIVMCGILLILATMSSAIVKPYRIKVYNIIDVVFLSTFIQILFSAAGLPFGIYSTKQLKDFKSLCLALVSWFPYCILQCSQYTKSYPNLDHLHNGACKFASLLPPITFAKKLL